MQLAPAAKPRKSLSVGCLLVLVLALPGAQATPPPDPVDAGELEVGDVVAEGVPTPLGCRFDEPTRVRLTPSDLGVDDAYVDVATDDRCRMVVQDVGPLHPLPPGIGEGNHSRSDDPTSGGSGDGGVSTMASSKEVHTDVIHYGDGGKDDELTMKTQWIDFSWDGSTAWINDHAGQCWWVSGWVNDACVLDDVIDSGDYVTRASHGDFHYEDLLVDGYYHTLEAYTYGYDDGDHFCDYGWEGDIVNGVYMECYTN